jgi:hypothetical protein
MTPVRGCPTTETDAVAISQTSIPFMVRYLPAPRLRQAGLTTNGKANGGRISHPFALRYRRVNGHPDTSSFSKGRTFTRLSPGERCKTAGEK